MEEGFDSDPKNKNSCKGVIHVSTNTYGMWANTSNLRIYSPSGKYAKDITSHTKINGSALARQPKTLKDADIDKVQIKVGFKIQKSVNQLFQNYEKIDEK